MLFNLTYAKTKIYIIGDSLIVGSKNFLIQMLNEYDLQIDAKIGRYYKTVFTKVNIIEPNSIVVVNLFNNSVVSYNDLEILVKKLSTKNVTIVFINTHVKRQWRDYNNRNLKLLKENYPQVYLIDWNSIFTNLCNSISCLQKDGVHLTKKGYYYYALAIASTINSIIR